MKFFTRFSAFFPVFPVVEITDFPYDESMKTIVRILILLEFAAIIFVPGIYMSRLLLIPMFLSMFGLVVLYWFAMFWVSRKDAVKVLEKEPESDFYVGKLPANPSADLVRGRLCFMDGRIILLQRTEDRIHRQTPCKEVWSADIADITSAGFGKVLPARNGFILYMNDDEVRFTCSKLAKHRELLYKALGWQNPDGEQA